MNNNVRGEGADGTKLPLEEVASDDLLESRSDNPKAGLGKATNFLIWCADNMPFYNYRRKAKALVSLLKPTTIPPFYFGPSPISLGTSPVSPTSL